MSSFIPLKLNTEPVEIDKKIEINGVRIDVLRLDKLHPVASGNKIYKLFPYINEAINTGNRTILTFGGAWSNHLHATAYVCKALDIRCIGIVRGASHEANSPTLAECRRMGMELHFMNRSMYQHLSEKENPDELLSRFGKVLIVPTGGYSQRGAMGAAQIADFIPDRTYTHTCVSVGTATTLAGIIAKKKSDEIIAFPALKGMKDVEERLHLMGVKTLTGLRIINEYHFGGFARYNTGLIHFMNQIYHDYGLPLDRVYTAKMMYGIFDMAKAGYFASGSKVLAIHTGGLQGNASLPANTLFY